MGYSLPLGTVSAIRGEVTHKCAVTSGAIFHERNRHRQKSNRNIENFLYDRSMIFMETEKQTGIGFFQKYLTLWVILCMVAGVLIGKFLPAIPTFLNRFEYAKVSIPMAVLIWLMIYPMMMKVDFQSIKNVGRNPKGLFVTWITNWLIKPFTMYGIASLFFFVIFKAFITPESTAHYFNRSAADFTDIPHLFYCLYCSTDFKTAL